MQETASNIIGYFFQKQPQQTSSKKQEDQAKNDNPLLLKFATDPYFGTQVDASINQKIAFDADHIVIPKKLFTSLLKSLEKATTYEAQIKEQQAKNEDLNKQIEELLAQNEQEKAKAISIEEEAEKAKQLLNDKIKELNDAILAKDKKLEKYKSVITEQEEELNRLKELKENEELESQLELSVNEYEVLKQRLSDLHFEYTKYKNIVYSSPLNGITSDLNTSTQKVTTESNEGNVEKKINLDYVFSERIGEKVCQYLDYQDILSLKAVNKFINIAITNNPRYSILMIKQMKKRWAITKEDLMRRIYAHRDLAAKIPDPYVKHAFSKYIWHKETVGEYMITSIIQSENFFNLVLDYEESARETPKAETSSGMSSFFSKIAKKIDDVKQANQKVSFSTLLDSQIPPNIKPATVQSVNTDLKTTQESLSSTQTDAVSREEASSPVSTSNQPVSNSPEQTIKSTQNTNVQNTPSPSKSIQTPKAESENPDDLFELPETKRQLFTTYYANNPFCVFIQGDAFRNPAEDKKQMLQKAYSYIEDMLRALIKKRNVIADNKELMSQLLQVFAKMLIHSKVLLQEAKELEALKDYVTSKYEEIKTKVSKFENSVEDYGEALQTERKLKDFFSKKAVDLEAQLHAKNTKILKDSESIAALQNQLKFAEESIEKTLKDKQDQDNKLKVVVKEIKNLRAKNKELEEAHNYVLTGYHDIKIVFDTLDLDI